MIKLMLGYDILADPALAKWVDESATDRESFFLRSDIRWPISVDRLTCPSIFQPEFETNDNSQTVLTRFPILPGALSKTATGLRAITQRSVDWEESDLNALGLWSKLERMRSWMRSKPEVKGFIRFPVAFQVYLRVPPASDPLWDPIAENLQSDIEGPSKASSIGFDVANREQSSALCGYSHPPEEIAEVRLRWSPYLNDWGLLDSKESATEFERFSDDKMPEHSPFYVYEIFRVEP